MTGKNFPSVISLDDRRKQNQADEGEKKADLFQGLPCEAPPCPAWLSKEAKKHWKYQVQVLKQYGLLTKLDQGTLAMLCTYYARARDAEIQLQENDEFQKTPNGYAQLSPYSVAFTRYSRLYNLLAAKFGMTPMSRRGVQIDNPNQGELDLNS